MTTGNIKQASEELIEHLEQLVPFFEGTFHDADQSEAADLIKMQVEKHEQGEMVDMGIIYNAINTLRNDLHVYATELELDETIEAYTVCHHALQHTDYTDPEMLKRLNSINA